MARRVQPRPAMRDLIVNADDLGMTLGVNRGVARAFDEGLVTSASIMANGPAFEDAVAVARRRPGLSVGLHLTLTDGAPVLPPERVPSLVDEHGTFHGYRSFTLRLLSGRLSKDELSAEIAAQLQAVESAGLRVSHLDGHRHVHLLPVLFDLVADQAAGAGLTWVRCPTALGERAGPAGVMSARALGLAGFGRLQYGRLVERGLVTADCFLGALTYGAGEPIATAAQRLPELPSGTTEWMVHPGEVDAELLFQHDYLWPRRDELAWLTSEAAHEAVARSGVRLVNRRGEPKLRVAAGARVA